MSRVNETNAAATAAARQKLRLLDHVHVTGEDGAADLAARNATAKGAVALRDRLVKSSIADDGDRRSLIRDDGGFPSSISVAVPERRPRSASDELAFSRSSSTRSTSPVRLTQAESPSPQLLAVQEAWDRAFEALFGINPVTAHAHLPDFSKSPATVKNSRRALVGKEEGESIGARPDYGTDGGRDGTQDHKVSSNSTTHLLLRSSEAKQTVPTVCSVNKPPSTSHSTAPDAQTVLTVSPLNESYIPSLLSRDERRSSALLVLLPDADSVASDMTSSAPPYTQRHRCVRVADSDSLRTCVLKTTENPNSRSACRKGEQRRETPVSHPNHFFTPSLSCSSGAQMIERPAPGPKTSADASAMPSRYSRSSGEQMSVQLALPVTTSNATPCVGERPKAVDRGVRLQSHAARQVGETRQTIPSALNPSKINHDSFSCSPDAQTSRWISSLCTRSSDVQTSAFAPPKIAAYATQRRRDRDRVLKITEGVVQATPYSTPIVQRRLPGRACVRPNGLESVVRLESRTTHRGDKARRCAVTLDARVIEELPFDETRVAAAAARDDALAFQPLVDTPTAADIDSERFGVAGGLKQHEAAPAYSDTDALRARAKIPSVPQKNSAMQHEPLRAGIVDDQSVSSVLQQPAKGRRSVHRTDAQCDSNTSSNIDFEVCRVRIEEKRNLEREVAPDSWPPHHAHNSRACFRDETSDRCLGEQAWMERAPSISSTSADTRRVHQVCNQFPPVPLYPLSVDYEATAVKINDSRWLLSGQETEEREAAAGARALVVRRRKPLDAALVETAGWQNIGNLWKRSIKTW
ncbi:hypothetical protein K438DRAFT_2019052 [Mycena galopus ATCC 62051]|nr:hypothetical protein K438DRAFT_2019052 [Mycena galopus ATCC 62051]